MWALNPHAYDALAPVGKTVDLLFLSLAVALALAATGWFKRRRWGWQLAVTVIGTQVLGDFINVFFGHALQGLVGIALAGALFFKLLGHMCAQLLQSNRNGWSAWIIGENYPDPPGVSLRYPLDQSAARKPQSQAREETLQ